MPKSDFIGKCSSQEASRGQGARIVAGVSILKSSTQLHSKEGLELEWSNIKACTSLGGVVVM